MRILVAEDDPTSLLMLATLIGHWNHEAIQTDNGWEAWNILRRPGSPQIAILDRGMPGYSGVEVCRMLREVEVDVPHYLILLTGKSRKTEIVEGLEAGANDYITKPFDPDELRARIAVGCRVIELQQALAKRVRELEESQKREEALRRKVEALGGWLGSRVAAYSDRLPTLSHLTDEVSQAIGVGGIHVYVLQDEKLVLLTEEGDSQIPLALIESVIASEEQIQIPGSIFLPMRAPSGLTLGALAVHGIGKEGLLREELKLVTLLGREIASGLELRRLRRDLEETRYERQKEDRRRTLIEGERLAVCPDCDRCYGDVTKICPKEGSELRSLPDVPFQISGRYRFERRLGTGGMGMVFRAFDSQLNRRVALKLVRLHPALMDAETNRQRFAAETQILARLNHPGIVTLYDSGELTSGTMYLVTELLNGRDLEEVISLYGPGNPRQVASLARQIGEALQAAHDMGLVHRDVKPANIFALTDAAGVRVKLIDFGLAKSEGSVRLTHESFCVGTPRYMAPEIFRMGESGPKADLYSLAAVVYEALTGTPAVSGTQIADVVIEVLEKAPEPVSDFLGMPVPSLDDLFWEGMAKRPEHRPGSVMNWTASVAEQLDRLPSTLRGWPEIHPGSGPIGKIVLPEP